MKASKAELTGQIKDKKLEIEGKKKELDNFELDPYDYERQYDECIDEEGPVIVAGIKFDVSYALKELDPTAYRCKLVDYVDSIDKEETQEYKEIEEELETLEGELEDLETELEELEEEE